MRLLAKRLQYIKKNNIFNIVLMTKHIYIVYSNFNTNYKQYIIKIRIFTIHTRFLGIFDEKLRINANKSSFLTVFICIFF